MAYNTLFEQLHDADDDEVRGLIAYGLYKIAKREWVQLTSANGKPPTPAELKAYQETWTPANIASKRAEADQVLRSYSDEVVRQERPRIIEEALRGSFWNSVLVNIVSAFIYTLILIALVVVLKVAGVDLLSIANST
ncbi:hypothetical protein [Sphingomonas bacterium]|uniref:hypothetical protein n=1 Tax=Sphingomonas bacterium TaxID=1895847 RepID=UPI0015766D42|nr:hypothetical protein [Sphingomonas bacterium]